MKSIIANLLVVVVAIATISMGSLAASAQTQRTKGTEHRAVASQASIKLQPLNVKLGLWETTTTIARTGAMPLPAGMLARLTPEQRARLEERMKAHSGANTSTTTDKHCLTKEELEKGADFGEEMKGANCTRTVTASSSTVAKGNFSCEVQGMRADGTLEIEAPDPEHVKGIWHGIAAGNGNSMKVDNTFSSKWLGSSCRGAE